MPPAGLDKEQVRALHRWAVQHRIARAKDHLARYEAQLLARLAHGHEVVPERITPCLVEVEPDSEDELLFRYVSLHWSVPVSSGYGRRLRFLVIDEQNGKLIGLFGLGDPVFSLAARDHWIGWGKTERKARLHHVMDAFCLGAVPPYSFLLCGKLVASLVTSNDVRAAFARKYGQRRSVILERDLASSLALVTTTSALGRSSLYNRLKFGQRQLFFSAGFTRGSGEFHFANGIYAAMAHYAERHCEPTAKQQRWGKGFRNRRELVRKCLAHMGLSTEWLYHGIHREVFVAPLAENARQFLCGEEPETRWFDQPAARLCAWVKERWVLPRAGRDQRYRAFNPSSYRLWRQ